MTGPNFAEMKDLNPACPSRPSLSDSVHHSLCKTRLPSSQWCDRAFWRHQGSTAKFWAQYRALISTLALLKRCPNMPETSFIHPSPPYPDTNAVTAREISDLAAPLTSRTTPYLPPRTLRYFQSLPFTLPSPATERAHSSQRRHPPLNLLLHLGARRQHNL